MKKKALIIGGSGGLSGRVATMAQKEYDVWVLTRGKRPLPDGVHPLTAYCRQERPFSMQMHLTFNTRRPLIPQARTGMSYLTVSA